MPRKVCKLPKAELTKLRARCVAEQSAALARLFERPKGIDETLNCTVTIGRIERRAHFVRWMPSGYRAQLRMDGRLWTVNGLAVKRDKRTVQS
jgi:hypothetical protein